MARTRRALLAVSATACFALVGAAPAMAGTLRFDRVLPGTFKTSECPQDALITARCFLVDIGGLVPGLGATTVHERVLQSGDMDADLCEPQVRYGTIATPRGTIDYVATGIDCPASREQSAGYRAVVVEWHAVGGTGRYAGASGGGNASVRPEGQDVFYHLHGSISVPGLEFDTVSPVFSFVPQAMTVRAVGPTVVRYRLPNARDAVDGDVRATCTPRSGTRFALGRTRVRCEAVDRSGNTRTAAFTVHLSRRGGR
jgi:hypothetical protein